MIERYTLPEMGSIWTDQNRYQKWLDVEIAVCEAWNRLGEIPSHTKAPEKQSETEPCCTDTHSHRERIQRVFKTPVSQLSSKNGRPETASQLCESL